MTAEVTVSSYLGRRKDKQTKVPLLSLTYPSLLGSLPLPYFLCSLLLVQIMRGDPPKMQLSLFHMRGIVHSEFVPPGQMVN